VQAREASGGAARNEGAKLALGCRQDPVQVQDVQEPPHLRRRRCPLYSARRRAGLDHATCHELRHTCLTQLTAAWAWKPSPRCSPNHDGHAGCLAVLHAWAVTW